MNCPRSATNHKNLSPEDMRGIRATIGAHIRSLRKRRKCTMEDLSHMAGIHLTFLGHIELGNKIPSIHTLVRIARSLTVVPSALLKGIR